MIVMRIATDEVQGRCHTIARMRKIRLLALLIAAFAFTAAAQVSEGDQHWNARAEGHVGGRAKAAQIDAAIGAYQKAVAQDPNNLEARWKLLRAMRFKGAYVASTVDEKKNVYAGAKTAGENAMAIVNRALASKGVKPSTAVSWIVTHVAAKLLQHGEIDLAHYRGDALTDPQTHRLAPRVMMLSDGTARVEVVVYDEIMDRHRNLVREDAVVLVEAKVRSYRRGGEVGETNLVMRIVAEKIHDLASVRARFGRNLRLSMNGAADAKKLKKVLEPYRNGSLRVSIAYTNGIATAEFDLGEDWKIRPDDSLISELGKWLEPKNVQIVYQ